MNLSELSLSLEGLLAHRENDFDGLLRWARNGASTFSAKVRSDCKYIRFRAYRPRGDVRVIYDEFQIDESTPKMTSKWDNPTAARAYADSRLAELYTARESAVQAYLEFQKKAAAAVA